LQLHEDGEATLQALLAAGRGTREVVYAQLLSAPRRLRLPRPLKIGGKPGLGGAPTLLDGGSDHRPPLLVRCPLGRLIGCKVCRAISRNIRTLAFRR